MDRIAISTKQSPRLGRGVLASVALVLAATSGVSAQAPPPPVQDWTRTEVRDDCSGYNPLRNVYFGDTHVHTSYSADSVLARNRNDVRDAYDFAQGITVGLTPYDGMDMPLRYATIDRPLDFMAVTDHAEGFGEAVICLDPVYAGAGYDDPICVDLRSTFGNTYQPTNALPDAFIAFFSAFTFPNPSRFEGVCGGPGYPDCLGEAAVVWQDTIDAAEENYDRTDACAFTTFPAYEWSSNLSGNNLHRNVIFRNNEVPALPISYYEQWTPEGLWAELQTQCLDQPGQCDVIAIPHGSNLAQDKMFPRTNMMTPEQAVTRRTMEPVVEVFQIKGDSECRSGVTGTTDELCNFEKLSQRTLLGNKDWNQTFHHLAYVRGALKEGLVAERRLGENPYAFGFVGATDTHVATGGGTSEVDFGRIGAVGVADSEPAFILADAAPPVKIEQSSGGLSVVWAEENSRDAIFAALRRRETYSTSGTRPVVRFFAGHHAKDLCGDTDFVAHGYDGGVPMGGDIGPALGKKSPRFAILAQKDPGTMMRPGTPLQRIQVVKGWIDAKTGETREVVYDVAGNPGNGAGVDPDTCAEDAGSGGFDELCTVWQDPKFDPTQRAFYYVRVVENPVCRWHKHLCNELKTCSVHLTSCSLDPTRTCTTNAECEAVHPGSTCTVDYPVVCVNDSDCDRRSAGTCGATPAVDCSNPGSLPPAAVQCCDQAEHPWTIQERAVTSPIWYHPGRAGLMKGRVTFDADPSEDRLQFAMIVPDSPDDLDPAANDLVLAIRDDATAWTATIPAGTMEVKKPGASYSYKDKSGAIGGITQASVKISSKGVAQIKVKTGRIDLSAISKASQKLHFDVTSGAYSSTASRQWRYDGKSKLSLAN